ncbi:hypothetical protein VLK31_24825 [Variovorax sp. H27-G14]|uniref:hypothetical protein n=1 Tax=Variovorax sp. H27-G14 TaxID=3111914 RepID=UPI0038FD341E
MSESALISMVVLSQSSPEDRQIQAGFCCFATRHASTACDGEEPVPDTSAAVAVYVAANASDAKIANTAASKDLNSLIAFLPFFGVSEFLKRQKTRRKILTAPGRYMSPEFFTMQSLNSSSIPRLKSSQSLTVIHQLLKTDNQFSSKDDFLIFPGRSLD